MVHNNAAVTQCIGMNGHAGSANLLCSCNRLLEVVEILFLMGRVYQRIICIAVEAGDGNACLFCRFTGCIQITDAPVPELNCFKAVILCCLEPFQPGQLGIQRINTSAFSQCHVILPPKS